MNKWIVFVLCLSSFFSKGYADTEKLSWHAVTYTLSGGRLGDNLVAYAHAKWVSYRYGIPILYRPFHMSNLFVFDDVEMIWTEEVEKKFNIRVEFKQSNKIDEFIQKVFFFDKVLYIIPYFPESRWELVANAHRSPYFPYFATDWKDPGFRALLKRLIAPKTPVAPMILPQNKITVALHLRKGGGYDDANAALGFPLKFPPDEFYMEQLRNLYYKLNEQPLYVHLFTDEQDPGAIEVIYQNAFSDLNIEFGCRKKGNRWDANVVEDLFALTQFDCAIHGESNFPTVASFLADYEVEIVPKTFYIEDEAVHIDEVVVKVKKR